MNYVGVMILSNWVIMPLYGCSCFIKLAYLICIDMFDLFVYKVLNMVMMSMTYFLFLMLYIEYSNLYDIFCMIHLCKFLVLYHFIYHHFFQYNLQNLHYTMVHNFFLSKIIG